MTKKTKAGRRTAATAQKRQRLVRAGRRRGADHVALKDAKAKVAAITAKLIGTTSLDIDGDACMDIAADEQAPQEIVETGTPKEGHALHQAQAAERRVVKSEIARLKKLRIQLRKKVSSERAKKKDINKMIKSLLTKVDAKHVAETKAVVDTRRDQVVATVVDV
eukprot:GHVT01047436.1.p1 GENE.GHVT01047436.1~~GHVT01047436.1.p1  ORF type:complete len:164 (+),score=36.18 GHVT01047436.1:111-602(+)